MTLSRKVCKLKNLTFCLHSLRKQIRMKGVPF